jgi:glucose/arabinose dehydrogenase
MAKMPHSPRNHNLGSEVRFRIAGVTALFLVAIAARPVEAQLRAVPYVGGLVAPIGFVQDPSNPAIQYVVQQTGQVRVIVDGVLRQTPFLDLAPLVALGGERGLLGLAFPPDFASSRRFYVYYTRAGDGDIVVARYKRSLADPFVADPAGTSLVWGGTTPYIEHSSAGNHNGGHMAFGPDGFLYIAVGDGGNTPELAQSAVSLLGKILRIDVNVADGHAQGYVVPPSNPFVDNLPIPALDEIWSFGLRNPWKFSFDDLNGGTNAMIVGDVGQGAWEEIDYEPAARGGRNYGWPAREGAHVYAPGFVTAYQPLTDPVFDYDRNVGSSITGGFVYRGTKMQAFRRGRYFYADFVRGRVWSLGLSVNAGSGEATPTDLVEHTGELGGSGALGAITSFGRDARGELYIVSYAGTIFRIVDITPPPDIQLVVFKDDGDVYADVLLYNRTTGAWTIQHGTAAGTFTLARSGGWAPGWRISVARFNADALDDLFLYNPSSGVWFKVTNLNGDFAYFTQGWQPGFTELVVDLDGNGLSDVFIYNALTGTWFSCLSVGSGTGGFDYRGGGWRANFRVLPADFDADGRADFLLYSAVDGTFYKAITRGHGVFLYSGGGWSSGWDPLVADLNGDGRSDVFLYNPVSGLWYRATSLGDGTIGFSYVMGGWASGWRTYRADFDGNASTDLFLYHPNNSWFKVVNSGSAFSYFGGGWDSWSLAVADLSGDNRSDVLLHDPTSGIWFQAETTTPGAFTYTTGTFPP